MENSTKKENNRRTARRFAVLFFAALIVLAAGVMKNNAYNRMRHHAVFSGSELFSQEGAQTESLSALLPEAAHGRKSST